MESCRILWSTQSGRAKACARRVKRVLGEQTTLQIEGVGSSFDDTPTPFLEWISSMDSSSFLLLFVSTTGDGEHCDSIRETWKALLSKSLPKDLLQGKQFAIFCLGDRAYGPQFCAAGRKLAVRLLQLGMSRCCDVGYGDDNTPNGGVFRDLDDWLEQQLMPLLEHADSRNNADSSMGLPSPTSDHPFRITWIKDGKQHGGDRDPPTIAEWQNPAFQPAYQEYFMQSSPITAYEYTSKTKRQVTSSDESTGKKQPPMLGTVLQNERITATDWEQETRHLRIQLQSTSKLEFSEETSPLPYSAGDIATILPFNSDSEVDRFLDVLPQYLQDAADRSLELQIDDARMNNSYTRWPRHFTLRGWLKYCADIHSLPEREDLRALSFYCSEKHEMGMDQRDKLRSLSETSEAALYADYVLREKRSWADVLFDFESLRVGTSKLSIEALLVLLPCIRPRDFSIASAPSTDMVGGASTFAIELCVAVVKGKTRFGRPYYGLCSEYLSRMIPNGDNGPPLLQVWIRPGSFVNLPLELSGDPPQFDIPILCVGAGTGVSPMRSLILERAAIGSAAASSSVGRSFDENNNILVFGCRKAGADYYYKEEWESMSERKLMRLLTAFSRDQFQKIYVQKVLREADVGTLITKHLLERSGALYIAGGPKMARAVKEEVVEALSKELGGEKQAKAFLTKLQRLGKFSIEAWS